MSSRSIAGRLAGPFTLTALTIAALTVPSPGCARPGPAPRDPPADARPTGLTPLDVRMHANISSVRTIHAALLRDDLASGPRSGAPARPPRAGRGRRALGGADSLPPRRRPPGVARAHDAGEARRLATELAVTCADCHMVYAREASFRIASHAGGGRIARVGDGAPRVGRRAHVAGDHRAVDGAVELRAGGDRGHAALAAGASSRAPRASSRSGSASAGRLRENQDRDWPGRTTAPGGWPRPSTCAPAATPLTRR